MATMHSRRCNRAEDITSRDLQEDILPQEAVMEDTDLRVDMAAMDQAMDRRDSIWIIEEAGTWGSWKRCWRVWRVVAAWMLACCSSENVAVRTNIMG
jgi:hypothetical protein